MNHEKKSRLQSVNIIEMHNATKDIENSKTD